MPCFRSTPTSYGTRSPRSDPKHFLRDELLGGIGIGKLALPQGNDAPAQLRERSTRLSVPNSVLLDFARPKFDVRLRKLRTATPVSVPKAAVDENRDSMLRKNEVGASGEIRPMQPKPEAEAMSSPSGQKLRRRVETPDRAHVSRSLFSRQMINHGLLSGSKSFIQVESASTPSR